MTLKQGDEFYNGGRKEYYVWELSGRSKYLFPENQASFSQRVIFELAFKGCLCKKAERRVISERKHIYIRHRDVIPHGALG